MTLMSPKQDSTERGKHVVATCPVCRNDRFDAPAERQGLPIQVCQHCGLTFQNPQPSDGELAAIYGPSYFIGSDDAGLATQFDLVKRGTARLQLDKIGDYLKRAGRHPKGLRLLEFGCGHGNLLVEANFRGYEVHGLEVSADAASVANGKLGREVVRVGGLSESGFVGPSFDVCILADVIEHVRDPRDFIRTVGNVMNDRAVIYIATPSLDSWSARVLGRHWMEYKREHLFYFDRRTIRRLLADLQFGDIQVSAGRKALTPNYVVGHFTKFPVPIVTNVLRSLTKVLPDKLLARPISITASGIDVLATKA
jgi:SAM-dependent methyltransferase